METKEHQQQEAGNGANGASDTEAADFAAALKEARGEWTQEQMARFLGVPGGTYVNWEQGRRTPRGYVQRSILARAGEAKKAQVATKKHVDETAPTA